MRQGQKTKIRVKHRQQGDVMTSPLHGRIGRIIGDAMLMWGFDGGEHELDHHQAGNNPAVFRLCGMWLERAQTLSWLAYNLCDGLLQPRDTAHVCTSLQLRDTAHVCTSLQPRDTAHVCTSLSVLTLPIYPNAVCSPWFKRLFLLQQSMFKPCGPGSVKPWPAPKK